MSDNNEYYAEKMRRLLEAKESRESIKLDDSKGSASKKASGVPEEIEEDFAFDEKREKIVLCYQAKEACDKQIIKELAKVLPKFMWPQKFAFYEQIQGHPVFFFQIFNLCHPTTPFHPVLRILLPSYTPC